MVYLVLPHLLDSKIDFNVFFIFLYTFAFCPYEHLVKCILFLPLLFCVVLLCACGINPSDEITLKQLSKFLTNFQQGDSNSVWNEWYIFLYFFTTK